MPFRERIKRALTRSSASSTTSNPSSTPTDASRRNSHIYQPGEKMPPPKYRRPVAPEHKEKLESFSWAKAWRRHSGVSQYSPMGSRVPSRKNSTAAPTVQGRRSYQAARASLMGSALTREMNGVVAIDHANGKSPFPSSVACVPGCCRPPPSVRRAQQLPRPPPSHNHCVSRLLTPTSGPTPAIMPGQHTHSLSTDRSRLSSSAACSPRGSIGVAPNSVPRSSQPWTQEDLALALGRSNLAVPQ